MGLKKELKELRKEAEKQGWRTKDLKKGFMFLGPRGGKVTIHGTPSDRRALQNTIARMRRHGFRWPPKS